MWKILCFLLVSSVLAHDVYHYDLDKTNQNLEFNLKDVVCPDGETCSDGQTCCPSSDGGYGCCPAPNAVCCSDNIHCCPQGTTCNLTNGTCDSTNNIMVSLMKRKLPSHRVKSVVCPDGQSECGDGQTCCRLKDGSYGCCPSPNAVCCSDKLHCCPEGTTCDVSQGTCNNANNIMVSLMKRKLPSHRVKSVVCPDGQSQCGDGQTCCRLKDGSYGCCPSPNAVCCSDKIHCCPEGTTCDVSQGTCNNADNIMVSLMKRKLPSHRVKSVLCPDGQSQCGDGQTCCLLQDGSYGCCPSPNAVCCSDRIHCCPEGTTCNLSAGSCDSFIIPFKWSKPRPMYRL